MTLLQRKALAPVLDTAINGPKTTPNDKQVSAPANASVTPDVVTAADFTSLLGLAVDTGLISQTAGATTLNLNLFAFVAAMNPRVLQEQEQYERFTNLRRLSGSITLGGKGDAIDQNGDGVIDDPKTAASATDIVTWELRVRLAGSRDRRDRQNYTKLLGQNRPLDKLDDAQFQRLTILKDRYVAEHPDQKNAKYYCQSDVKSFVAKPANAQILEQYSQAEATMKQNYDAIAAEIDKSFLLTAVIGGTDRHKDIYGPDKRSYGLSASWAKTDMTLDANLSYNQIKSFRGEDQQKSAKFGLAYNGTYLRDLVGYKDQGVTLTVAAAFEKYHNVPAVAHDNIQSVNLKLTYPVTEAINLPFSITWANHADLLKAEKEVRGHIGFTYDLSPLFKPAS